MKNKAPVQSRGSGKGAMMKVIGWILLIIFVIGLLVVLGVFKAIF